MATVDPSTGLATAVGYGSVDVRAESGPTHGIAVLLVLALDDWDPRKVGSG